MSRRDHSLGFAFVLALLVSLHFALRPLLQPSRWAVVAPDFLLLTLMLYAIRSRPSAGAVAGLTLGLLGDTLTVRAFGAGALAYTVVGYFAAWGKAVFFADNLLVNAGFFFIGTWVRDLIMYLASGLGVHRDTLAQLALWSPLRALSTALVGLLVLFVFRRWINLAETRR